MEEKPKLTAHKITKPIQLLAAWLVGLVLVDGSLLTTAAIIHQPEWIPSMLTIAAVANVYVFIFAIFMLQTKFRPEMQEDQFYHEYLVSKSGNTPVEPVSPELESAVIGEHSKVRETVVYKLNADNQAAEPSSEYEFPWIGVEVSVNRRRKDLADLLSVLQRYRIPVSGTFGAALVKVPKELNIAFGPGVTPKAVVSLVKALGDFKGNIEFLWYDDLPGDFIKKVMIGTFGKPKGIKLAAARELVGQGTLGDEQILEVIGKGEYQTLD